MLARIRARLTYANVVATLALFIALGGSAYAVSKVTSKEVRNRSLRGIDLRRDTLTGKEIRESKLGVVPSATSAATAATAGLAANANALGGQDPTAFEKSSRIEFRRAPYSPSSPAERQTLLDWPALGARITTSTTTASCSPGKLGIRFANTRGSGPFLRVIEDGSVVNLPPNTDYNVCSLQDWHLEGAIGDTTGPTLWFDCVAIESEARCLGTRSEP